MFAKNIQFLIVDRGEEIPPNKWYRMSHWQSEHFLRMATGWDNDWKIFSNEEKVVGVSSEDRDIKFLRLLDQPEFKIYLEKDPSNEYDSNAVKVMGSATIEGKKVVEELGFLSKDTAQQLKDEKELDAHPYSVYLPVHGHKYGLSIRVLVRSKRYRDKTYGKSASPVPKRVAWEPPPWTEKDEEDLKCIYEEFGDKDSCEARCIKKPSKKLIKQAVKMLHNRGVSCEKAWVNIEWVVEKLIEIKPDLQDY